MIGSFRTVGKVKHFKDVTSVSERLWLTFSCLKQKSLNHKKDQKVNGALKLITLNCGLITSLSVQTMSSFSCKYLKSVFQACWQKGFPLKGKSTLWPFFVLTSSVYKWEKLSTAGSNRYRLIALLWPLWPPLNVPMGTTEAARWVICCQSIPGSIKWCTRITSCTHDCKWFQLYTSPFIIVINSLERKMLAFVLRCNLLFESLMRVSICVLSHCQQTNIVHVRRRGVRQRSINWIMPHSVVESRCCAH